MCLHTYIIIYSLQYISIIYFSPFLADLRETFIHYFLYDYSTDCNLLTFRESVYLNARVFLSGEWFGRVGRI